jgi:hypothetical protein
MNVTARRGFSALLLGSGRTPAWNKADRDYRAAHPNCEMCGIPKGSLGKLDGQPGTQENIEAHDVKPWHLLTKQQQNDYNFLYANMIALHHFEHHHEAHCGDPNCLQYNPNIRAIAAQVLAARTTCQT